MSGMGMLSALNGQYWVRHAVLTYNGTWGAGLVQYPGDTVNGADQALVVEVPCPYPATFGFIGGQPNSPSYQQSIQAAIDWTANWLAANPYQTFALCGYSQGAEAASRVAIELMGGSLSRYADNWIGGITYGNPSRLAGAAAPGIGNPGFQWRGISSVRMPALPTINSQIVWADYFHSKTEGDPANDMYACVPDTQVGAIMTDVYTATTELQLNAPQQFGHDMVSALLKIVSDSGVLSHLKGGIAGLIALGLEGGIEFLVELIGGVNINATGVNADVSAAVLGMQFLTAPGGATAPHISDLGEIPGYRNLVADGVDFLNFISNLTVPRTALAA